MTATPDLTPSVAPARLRSIREALSSGRVRREHPNRWHDFLASFAVLVLILNSTQAFLVAYSDVLLLFSCIVIFAIRIFFRRSRVTGFATIIAGAVIWLVAISAYWGVFDFKTAVGFTLRFLLPYWVFCITGWSFFGHLHRWTVRLTSAALIAFAVSILAPSAITAMGHDLGSLQNLVVFRGGATNAAGLITGGWERMNFGFFTFAPGRILQNHGFMWEPAAFALVLNFVLAIDLLRGNLSIDRSKCILIAGILTSFSSTGVFILFLTFAYWLSRVRGFGLILSTMAVVVAIAASTSLSFLMPKLLAEVQLGAAYANPHVNWSLTRYASFVYDWRDFVEHPLLGRGIYLENRYTGHLKLPSNNGLSDLAARFGLIGITFVFISAYKSGLKVSRGSVIGAFYFCVVIAISGWSERFFELPLFVGVLISHLFAPRRRISQRWKRFRLRTHKEIHKTLAI